MGRERLDVDGELEIVVELDDVIRRLQTLRDHHAQTLAHRRALPFCAEIALNASHEAHTHEVAPPPDGFSVHDEPPSRPLPQ